MVRVNRLGKLESEKVGLNTGERGRIRIRCRVIFLLRDFDFMRL